MSCTTLLAFRLDDDFVIVLDSDTIFIGKLGRSQPATP